MIRVGNMHARLHAVRNDERGSYAIEYAIILPAFLMLMMGTFDIGFGMYAKSVLAGSVDQAARASTLEVNSTDQTSVDDKVRGAMGTVARYATLSFARTSYESFSSVGAAERFTDSNGNGTREVGECYEDSNNNGTWNSVGGTNGQGGADDVVLYRVTMSYDRLFPLWKMLGQPQHNDIVVTTVLRNQPYSNAVDNSVARCN
jgi:Flp pilus assembly protein TadG